LLAEKLGAYRVTAEFVASSPQQMLQNFDCGKKKPCNTFGTICLSFTFLPFYTSISLLFKKSISTTILQRHLRNAHPGEIDEGQKDGLEDDMQDMVGHHMDDSDRVSCIFIYQCCTMIGKTFLTAL
jgi:hypothetical protein